MFLISFFISLYFLSKLTQFHCLYSVNVRMLWLYILVIAIVTVATAYLLRADGSKLAAVRRRREPTPLDGSRRLRPGAVCVWSRPSSSAPLKSTWGSRGGKRLPSRDPPTFPALNWWRNGGWPLSSSRGRIHGPPKAPGRKNIDHSPRMLRSGRPRIHIRHPFSPKRVS